MSAFAQNKGNNDPGALKVTDLQPIKARKSEREVCVVKVEGGDAIGVKYALLYTIYSAEVPADLKKIDPSLLKQDGFSSARFGAFHGRQGSVTGFIVYDNKMPNEVNVSLGEGQSATGAIGVRVQVWYFTDGKWKPRTQVSEKTIQLDEVK